MTMRLEPVARAAGTVLLAGALALGAAPAWATSIGLDGNYHDGGGHEGDHHEGGWGGPVEVVDVPTARVAEPASLILMGMGLAGAALAARRARRA